MPSVKASFPKHHLLGDTHTSTLPPPELSVHAGCLPAAVCSTPSLPLGFSAKPAAPCNALSAVEFPGVMRPRSWAWIPSGFRSIAASSCAFPHLVRYEDGLGSVRSANVMVLIKCNSCKACLLHIGKDINPCSCCLEQVGLNSLLLIQ